MAANSARSAWCSGRSRRFPYQVEAAHEFLEGKELSDDVAMRASEIILKDAVPLDNNGYKVPIAQALIRRTLKQLVG